MRNIKLGFVVGWGALNRAGSSSGDSNQQVLFAGKHAGPVENWDPMRGRILKDGSWHCWLGLSECKKKVNNGSGAKICKM